MDPKIPKLNKNLTETAVPREDNRRKAIISKNHQKNFFSESFDECRLSNFAKMVSEAKPGKNGRSSSSAQTFNNIRFPNRRNTLLGDLKDFGSKGKIEHAWQFFFLN